MADLKRKGDLAELKVATDLLRQGYRIALPYGEDWEADLIIERAGRLERVQVKYTTARNDVVEIIARSLTLTNGKVIQVKRYTAETIDWLAAYEPTTDRCFYVPALELGSGQNTITLRLAPPRNNQRRRIRMAADYERLALPSAPSRGRGDNGNTRPLQG